MSFDLARVLRRLKPSRFRAPLKRRSAADLPFVAAPTRPGPELLLDTTVYVDVLQGRSPAVVDDLLSVRVCNHSSVCVAELTHAYGRLDPAHPNTTSALSGISEILGAMKPYRVREPSQAAWGYAGILAGLVFRLGDYHKGQERKLLNDALVFVQALDDGQVVLTRNIRDFDMLNQLVPEGRILLYSSQ